MHKFYIILIALFSFNNTFSQDIKFSNLIFKNMLLQSSENNEVAKNIDGNFFKIDSNNDGEIQESEALLVSHLNLDFEGKSETPILWDGIDFFKNLTSIFANEPNITHFDYYLPNLNELILDFDVIEVLDLRGLCSLTYSRISGEKVRELYLKNENQTLPEIDFQSSRFARRHKMYVCVNEKNKSKIQNSIDFSEHSPLIVDSNCYLGCGIISNINVTTEEDTSVDIDLTPNDINESPISYSVNTAPSNGKVIITDGIAKYTPNENFFGTETFVITADNGIDDISGGKITVVVTPVNDIPMLINRELITDEDNDVNIKLTPIDPDSESFTYSIVSPPSNGKVFSFGNNFTYRPNDNFNGLDNFKVIVNDGISNSSEATINIKINAVNDAPIASDDFILVDENKNVTILDNNETSLLHNDIDIENNTILVTLVSEPRYGSLTLDKDGLFSYKHDGSETFSDSFTYKINDGFLNSNVATVNITINPVNDNTPSDIILSSNSIRENLSEIIIGQFTAIDLDLPSDEHSFELVDGIGDNDNTAFGISNNNLFSKTSFDYEEQTKLSIRVKVTDKNNQSFEKPFEINVIDINDIAIKSKIVDSNCSDNLGNGSIRILDVSQTSGSVSINWTASNGGSVSIDQEHSSILKNLSNGRYHLQLTDDNNIYNETFEINLIPQYDKLNICYVSSDDTEKTKNRIYLNNQGNYNVAFYEILKESNISNIYNTIGTITPDKNSFLDETSNNSIQPFKYKVRSIDSCGNTSLSSNLHKTILLQSSISVDKSVNLNWSRYEGKDYDTYNIYRNTNSEGFVLIGSVSESITSFNDITANVNNNNYEYYISIDVNECQVESQRKNLNKTTEVRSNFQKLNEKILSINNFTDFNQLYIYPNPAKNNLSIKFNNSLKFIKGKIFNKLGQQIQEIKEINFSIENLPSSTYFIKIYTTNGIIIKRFIKR